SGEYIAVLDADDVMHAERLARQAAFLDAHPDVGAVGSALGILGRPDEVWRWEPDDAGARGKLLFQGPVSYGAMMVRRGILDRHGLRCDEDWRSPGMDYLFVAKLAPDARYANLPQALTFYRVGENNMRHGRDQAADRAALMRELLRRFGIEASDEEVDAHVMLFGMQRRPCDAPMARALRRWVDRLIAENRALGHFPQEVFEAEVRRRWQARFHAFADHSLAAALAYARCGGPVSSGRARYALAAAWRRVRGERSSARHP
ncbi:MAG: glycosyltransferase, partial [Flavobacteriales bacterium]